MTKQRGIGTYLAQGWAANAILTYLLILGCILYWPEGDLAEVLLIVVPICCFFSGAVGASVTAVIWSVEFALGRRFNLLSRVVVAILLPILLTMASAALGGFLLETQILLWVAGCIAGLVLLPVLLAGVRFNPVRLIVMDLGRDLPNYGWVRAITLLTVPLLRLFSVLGLLEAFLYLACRRSPLFDAWDLMAREFLGAIVAVVYFAITLVVALCLPQKIVTVAIGIVTNVPVAAFVFKALSNPAWNNRLIAILGGMFVILWSLFLFSRTSGGETRRLIPVTMFEVRIRHALNYW